MAYGIELLADVRAFPRSRHHPQFNAENLAAQLEEVGIRYRHMPELGGRRKPLAESINSGWDHPAFRGYADYAIGERFALAYAELRELARERRTCLMCAEALWWRCHRRLLADRLLAEGFAVQHIHPDGRRSPHRLTPFARQRPDGSLSYPPP